MPLKRAAKYLSGVDRGKTISMYCKDTLRSITIDILAVEHWPGETIVWVPADLNQEPYHLDPEQNVLITGTPTPAGIDLHRSVLDQDG